MSARISVTVDGREGWSVEENEDSSRTAWFAGYLLNPPATGRTACRRILAHLDGASTPDLEDRVRDLDGHFAFVVREPRRAIAAVDRIRSIPLFFATGPDGAYIDPWALRLRDHLGLGTDEIEPSSSLSLAMSGYTLGGATLYGSLRQLRPGELLVASADGTHETRRYYTYRPRPARPAGPELVESLTEVTRHIFEKLASLAAGRTVLVPLSGGLDSRLVVAGLREVGYEDVATFAYGIPGNFEATTSREVARRLGVPWFFIPVTHRATRRALNDPEHDRYLRWTDSCASVPVEHEFVAVAELVRRGWRNDEVLIVNGQSGDYLTGGHVPSDLASRAHGATSAERQQAITSALIRKHYSLWETLKTPENLAYLRSALWEDIAEDATLGDVDDDYGLYEMSEWQNRQCRYIVTNQRIYEFFGFHWALPLWDRELMDFWETVPLTSKLDQSLYRRMLEEEDWGGVWRTLPSREYVSPRWLRATRPLLKALVGGIAGKERWKSFDHRYLAYWMDVQGKIAVAPYRRVVRDRRGWRHAVSWLTESYLARHGMDWRGQPLTAGRS